MAISGHGVGTGVGAFEAAQSLRYCQVIANPQHNLLKSAYLAHNLLILEQIGV